MATPLGMGANEYYSVNIFGKAFNMILATRRESSGQRIKELYLHNAQMAAACLIPSHFLFRPQKTQVYPFNNLLIVNLRIH